MTKTVNFSIFPKFIKIKAEKNKITIKKKTPTNRVKKSFSSF